MKKTVATFNEVGYDLNATIHLINLVLEKNAINRRRRRFWHRMDELYKASSNSVPRGRKEKVAYADALAGYNRAKIDGKKFGKRLRYVREAYGAKFYWNDGGAIMGIRFTHDSKFIYMEDIKVLLHDLLAEKHLLCS